MYQYYCSRCGWERGELLDDKDYSVWCPNCKDGYCNVKEIK